MPKRYNDVRIKEDSPSETDAFRVFEHNEISNSVKSNQKTVQEVTKIGTGHKYKYGKFSVKEITNVLSGLRWMWLIMLRFHLNRWDIGKVRCLQTIFSFIGKQIYNKNPDYGAYCWRNYIDSL